MTKADLAGFPQFSFVEEAPALWKGRVLASLFGILALAALFAGAAVTRMSPRRLAA
jgi:hypothetical protein